MCASVHEMQGNGGIRPSGVVGTQPDPLEWFVVA